MEPLGFIHDMMDVKVLILYVAARLNAPVGLQDLYALAYQDDRLSYFDVCTAVPALVASGHLAQVGQGYEITEKGRTDCAATEDSLAYPVRQRAEKAVELVLADELDELQKIELNNTLIERNSVMTLKPESRKGNHHVAHP